MDTAALHAIYQRSYLLTGRVVNRQLNVSTMGQMVASNFIAMRRAGRPDHL